MSQRTLDQWLDWQSGLNPKHIDLGLDRVRHVWLALGSPAPAATVVTVAGTNGKGSSVAMLEAILRQAGYRAGCYTSPHLQRYNERIRIDGRLADDAAICQTFERIEAVRGDTRLTYFEFGTLAALLLFADSGLDVAILEVGLGGRLDAVNIIDADVALITGIALDHTDWLGDSMERIGVEKAGIVRRDRPLVFAAPDMPASVGRIAARHGAHLLRLGQHYRYKGSGDGWDWIGENRRRSSLPMPGMRGAVQLQNAAGVLQVIECLQEKLPVDQQAIRSGLLGARVPGRFEIVQRNCRWVLDVAHNPQAVQGLAAHLGEVFVAGQVHAVVGMLADKAISEVLAAIGHRIDCWHLVDLSAEHRGASGVEIRECLAQAQREQAVLCEDLESCLQALDEQTGTDDLVVVFGSFITVGRAMQWFDGYTSPAAE